MEPTKPLSAEEKLELEMDKVIEFEQEPIMSKNLPIPHWLVGGFIGAIVFILLEIGSWLITHNQAMQVNTYTDCSDGPCNPTTIFELISNKAFLLNLLVWIIFGAILGIIYGLIKKRFKKNI